MAKFIEFKIGIVADDYKDNRELYCQKINYDYVFQNDPYVFQKVIAVINKLNFNEEKLSGKRKRPSSNNEQKDV